jgi:hypothetical protein
MKVVSGLVLVGLVALAAAALPAFGAPKPQTISITSVEVGKTKQTGPHTVMVNDNDFSGTTMVGHDTLTCNTKSGRCDVAISLTNGNILAHFTSSAGSTGGGPITGGTGAYAGATGSFTFKNLNAHGTRTAVTLNIK